jgi:hypothetical protein
VGDQSYPHPIQLLFFCTFQSLYHSNKSFWFSSPREGIFLTRRWGRVKKYKISIQKGIPDIEKALREAGHEVVYYGDHDMDADVTIIL